ncbi:MAG: hypothetical protein ABS36_04815 [Acidobacteria bacterium SCN 69-37]|nr:MAG: hypothetical protein ABS36_04815 [Acidobacteria bacterium SCN 69-37]
MRRSWERTTVAALAVVAMAMLGTGLHAGARGEQRAPGPSAAAALRATPHFSADLVVRHKRVTASGAPMGRQRPDVRMHIVRESRGGRWVTSLSAERAPAALVEGPAGQVRLANPFQVSRVEFTDGETEPRLYDGQGRRVRPMSADDLRLIGATTTLAGGGEGTTETPATGAAGLLAKADGQAGRRADLERRFGRSTGRVRGLDRYVVATADGRHEVLVAPETALPVEVVTESAAAGQMRTGVNYESRGAYGYVRRLLRSEYHFADTAAGRAVTEVELANVVLTGEVRP